MNKLRILLIVCLGFYTCMYSQISKDEFQYLESQIPREKVALQINTNILLAGEFLYYQVVCLNTTTNTLSAISKIAYVELVGADENVIIKQKLNTPNSLSDGAIFIPASIKTGHYQLIAYTNWSKNNTTDRFYQKDIYIINPFTTDHQLDLSNTDDSNIIEISKTNVLNHSYDASKTQIRISTNKTSYKPREKVTVELSKNAFSTYNGIYTLSVRKMDSLVVSNKPKAVNPTFKTSEAYYLPELRGNIITGVLSSTNASVANKQVALSISGTDFVFKNVMTDEQGHFYFILSENYKTSDAIIQVQEPNSSDYTISLNEEHFDNYDTLKFNALKLDSNINNWLKTRSINNQIENAYFSVKADSIIARKPNETFYNAIATTYKLDDYNRFPTVKETFTEIITTAALSKRGDDYEFQVPDLANLHFNNTLKDVKPLVLVDGVLIQDNHDIVNYKANNIERISTVTGHYIYGSKIYNGVISITTKTTDFALAENNTNIKKVQLLKPINTKIYYQPDYSLNSNKRIPDYRTQLLWKPNMTLSNDTPKTLSFFTSDNKGLYEIVLEGYTTDGKHVRATNYFNVN